MCHQIYIAMSKDIVWVLSWNIAKQYFLPRPQMFSSWQDRAGVLLCNILLCRLLLKMTFYGRIFKVSCALCTMYLLALYTTQWYCTKMTDVFVFIIIFVFQHNTITSNWDNVWCLIHAALGSRTGGVGNVLEEPRGVTILNHTIGYLWPTSNILFRECILMSKYKLVCI